MVAPGNVGWGCCVIWVVKNTRPPIVTDCSCRSYSCREPVGGRGLAEANKLQRSGYVWTTGLRFMSAASFLLILSFFQLACPSASAAPAEQQGDAVLNRALHAWAGFPVQRSPRPLVLLHGDVLGPDDGFPTTAAKDAYGNGEINAPASWPATPASSMGYPIVGASGAFKKLTTSRTSSHPIGTPPPLSTTGVQLGTGQFLTDRGYRTLPAWIFSFSGVDNPAKVLAVGPSAIYSAAVTRGGTSPAQMSATVDAGGRHLVANFAGAPAGTGPCTASYTLAIRESKQAVAVELISHTHGSPYASCFKIAYLRHATAELTAPLGARVVVDASSDGAMSVTDASPGNAKGG